MKLFEIAESVGKKAGVLPYVIEHGEPVFMFMVASDPKYGGAKPMISKGNIDGDETTEAAAIREAEEELGLQKSNMKENTFAKLWSGMFKTLSEKYVMTIYMVEVKNKKKFNKPHYETGATFWMTKHEFEQAGRKDHIKIVQDAYRLLTT